MARVGQATVSVLTGILLRQKKKAPPFVARGVMYERGLPCVTIISHLHVFLEQYHQHVVLEEDVPVEMGQLQTIVVITEPA